MKRWMPIGAWLLLAAPAPLLAQSDRIALDVAASVDAAIGSQVPRSTGVWLDAFVAFRIAEGLDAVARPIVNRRTFDGEWQKQLYQLGVRYERPGRIGLRLEGGYLPSPIGIGLLENRPDLNPLVSQHSAYYLPLPRIDPDIPRTFLIAAAYPLGAQATISGKAWDARAAVLDSSPVRGRPFFGDNKPPRMMNTVVGVGVRPSFGVRLGAALAHGGYASATEVADPRTGDREATMLQVEGEWSFDYTRIAGEFVRSLMQTARADASARGGWIEVTQTLTPRWFAAVRGDHQRFRAEHPSGDILGDTYDRFEAILGYRISPDFTLRGGYLGRKGYVVSHWDDQAVVSAVWSRKIR
jgi:hypothetical protein